MKALFWLTLSFAFASGVLRAGSFDAEVEAYKRLGGKGTEQEIKRVSLNMTPDKQAVKQVDGKAVLNAIPVKQAEDIRDGNPGFADFLTGAARTVGSIIIVLVGTVVLAAIVVACLGLFFLAALLILYAVEALNKAGIPVVLFFGFHF